MIEKMMIFLRFFDFAYLLVLRQIGHEFVSEN